MGGLLHRRRSLVGLGLMLVLASVAWVSISCSSEDTAPTTQAAVSTTSSTTASSVTQDALSTTTIARAMGWELTIDSARATKDFVDAENAAYDADGGHVFLVLEMTLHRPASASARSVSGKTRR